MRSQHFWGVTQLSWVVDDFSEQAINSMFDGKISCPETLVRNYPSEQRNYPEERRSLRFTCPWLQYIPV